MLINHNSFRCRWQLVAIERTRKSSLYTACGLIPHVSWQGNKCIILLPYSNPGLHFFHGILGHDKHQCNKLLNSYETNWQFKKCPKPGTLIIYYGKVLVSDSACSSQCPQLLAEWVFFSLLPLPTLLYMTSPSSRGYTGLCSVMPYKGTATKVTHYTTTDWKQHWRQWAYSGSSGSIGNHPA